ncbi:2-dehydropantoate 2-reductase N-terminal domain-containing protein [Psychroserpens sp. AS72]|uniref:2-dehydropantoate 2-reductase N-terminal domain-containing protein n=1 Tax=Psychroserpens sp. AS72 TaxID=3135775 RepID=UPI00318288A3
MNTKTQIGILGVGAIGTVIACYLNKKTGNELFYFSRTKKEQLKLITHNASLCTAIETHTSNSKIHQLDWLIICIKAHQYEGAKHWFTPLIQPKTKVVVIRNGLQLKEPILPFTSEQNILECIIDCPTELVKNKYYKTLKTPLLTVPKSTLANTFELLFNTSEIDILQVQDFKTQCWKKLCESATLGAILCLHNDTCRIFKSKSVQKQYRNLIAETIKVAVADGAKIEANFSNNILTKILNYPDTKGSSMLTDLRNNKLLELDAKNGIISQLGKQYNIETRLNDSIIIKLKSEIKN